MGGTAVPHLVCNALLATFERLRMGVLVLSRTGRVVFSSRRAEAVLANWDGLAPDRGRFRNASPEGPLGQAVRQALDPANARVSLMGLPAEGGAPPIAVEVSPLRRQGHVLGVLVLTADPAPQGRPSTWALERVHGLTPAEGEVLARVVEGHRSSEIARLRRTSPETVRSQVKALLAKTGARSRADLVRLALACSFPLDPARDHVAPSPRRGPDRSSRRGGLGR